MSVEASFFELGGNSLRAVLLARRLSEALEREVGMAEVLQRPTVAAVASEGSERLALRVTSLPPFESDFRLFWLTPPSSWEEVSSSS